jgi:ribonuclease HI
LKLVYLETDASVDTRHEVVGLESRLFPAGAGIILRDIRFRPLITKSIPLGPLPGPLHAEYLALVHGLEEALLLGAEGVWATTDNQRLVEDFNGRSENRVDDLPAIAARLELARVKFAFVTLLWSRGTHRKLKLGGPTVDALARAAIGLGRRM